MKKILFKPTHLLLSLALLVIAAVLVYVLARGLDIDQSKPRSVLVGKPAPAFVLQWLQGDNWLRELQAGRISIAHTGQGNGVEFLGKLVFQLSAGITVIASFVGKGTRASVGRGGSGA